MGWKSKVAAVSLSTWALICAPSWAAESDPLNLPAPERSKPVAVDSGSYLLKTLIALAVVVLIIWVAYKLLKKLNLRASSSGRGPAVEVVSRTQLDREMAIYVLRLGSQISVVSKAGSGSTVLSSMSEEEALGLGLLSSVNESDQRLKSVFQELRSRMGSRTSSAAPAAVDALLGEELDMYVGDSGPATVDELLASTPAAADSEPGLSAEGSTPAASDSKSELWAEGDPVHVDDLLPGSSLNISLTDESHDSEERS